MSTLEYRSSTNFQRTSKYVELLTRRNLIECADTGRKLYRTTARGHEAAGILADAEEVIFGENDPLSMPAVFQDRKGVASGTGDGPNLGEVKKGFAILSRICKLRNEDRCGLCGGECRFEDCLLFVTNGCPRQGQLLHEPAMTAGLS